MAAAVGRRGRGFHDAVDRYAPTLMPIVAVYFAAHYLLYLVTYGQLTWKVIIDPLERDWVPDLGVWTGYPSGAAWAFQVTVIVLGTRVRDLRRAPHRARSRLAAAARPSGCRRP